MAIQFVYPDSPASRAGLKRGDVIYKINGQLITENNYMDLYNSDNLTLTLGTISDNTLTELSPTINITSEELQINPILQHTIFDYNNKKIGYLAYTSFISEYDDELQAVFSQFKSENITDLILDLRYNPGGAVETARLMASMICPSTCFGKTFIRNNYNNMLNQGLKQQYPDEPELFLLKFENNPNNLNLSKLYVLTTKGTASASEMVIYSLSPYMDVIQIGEETHGKYYASITIHDEKNSHNWAI